VLIISNEEKKPKFQQKIMSWLLANEFNRYAITKKRLAAGGFTEEERLQIEEVQKLYSDLDLKHSLRFVHIADADMSVVSKKIREYVLKEGFDTVLYDTFKIQASDMKELRQDLALVRDTRLLDTLAQKYNLVMLCSLQLAEHTRGKLWLDSSCLSNSKQIKEQLENLFLMRNLYDEELDPQSKQYCRPFQFAKVNGRWVEQDVFPDRTKVWKVLFIEKARSGSNTSDSGVAYLYQFDGDHSTFYEYCRCRPRHGQII
jgi:hypothetical protein